MNKQTLTVDELSVIRQRKLKEIEPFIAETFVTVSDSLVGQFKKEIGRRIQVFNHPEYVVKARLGVATPSEHLDYMLRQKYGLLPPQLTHSERNLILKEEQRLARK